SGRDHIRPPDRGRYPPRRWCPDLGRGRLQRARRFDLARRPVIGRLEPAGGPDHAPIDRRGARSRGRRLAHGSSVSTSIATLEFVGRLMWTAPVESTTRVVPAHAAPLTPPVIRSQ